MVPVLAEAEALAVTVYVTVLLPLPDAAPVMTIQLTLLMAVHELFVAGAETVMEPLPPPLAKFAEVGSREKLAGGGVPACVMVRLFPAMVSVPARAPVALFAGAE